MNLTKLFNEQELKDFSELENPEAKRLFSQLFIKRNFPALVYVLGYRDLGEFHKNELESLAKSNRRKLSLWARGHFKTSLITEAHTIWLIIKNPNIRVLIVSNTLGLAQSMLKAIRDHFISNNEFRYFFKELCPQANKDGKVEWGTTEKITVPRGKVLKEPTVMCAGIGTNLTGLHFDCLLPDTEILTSNGWKKIKDVRVRDRVLTLNGNFKNVTDKIKKKSDKGVVRIYPSYFASPSEFTEDHKIFIFDGQQFMWVEAKDIKPTDFLVVPRMKSNNGGLSKINKRINNLLKKKDIWRLIGYWLAEGASTEGNSIRLTFAQKEIDYIEDIRQIVKTYLDKDITVSNTKSNTSVIFFTDIDFKTIINTLGSHSYNKHIPPFFLNNNSIRQKELVLGYFRGDGCVSSGGIHFTSVSKDLLTGIQLLLAKWGIHSSLRKDTDGGESEICNVKCNTRPKYSLNSASPLANIFLGGKTNLPYRENTFFTNKYWCIPIRSIEKRIEKYPYDVYDITVNGEHNFFCQGMIAHNCMKIDDLVTKDSVSNEEQIKASKEYYASLRSLFHIPTEPWEYVIGTTYHFNDLYQDLLKNPEFEKSVIPCKMNEKITFPERFTEEGLNGILNDPSVGPYQFYAQYMLNPVNPKDAKFKSEWIEYYDKLPDLAEYICCDPASTRKKKSDFTVIERWGIDHEGYHYLLEGIRDKLTSFERVDKLFEIAKRAKNLKRTKYEVLGGRHGDLENIRKREREEGIFLRVQETKSTNASKTDRIEQRLVGPYHAGMIRYPRKLIYKSLYDGKTHDFVQDLITELLQFPHTIHDDCLDCQSQMFEEKLAFGSPPKEKISSLWKVTPDIQLEKALNKRVKKVKVLNIA